MMAIKAPPPVAVSPAQAARTLEKQQAVKKQDAPKPAPPPPPAPSVNTSGQVTGTTISTSA
jgi:hypothetical protein